MPRRAHSRARRGGARTGCSRHRRGPSAGGPGTMPLLSAHVGVRRSGSPLGMNEIVVTGSTGVIGRRAVRELLGAGHRVTGVTRSARGRERLAGLGARAVEVDVFDEASLRRAFDGADT